MSERRESGQASIEAALLVPLAFIVLFALCCLAFLAGTTELLSMAVEDTSYNVDVSALYDAQQSGNQGAADALVQDALCRQPVIALLGTSSVTVSNAQIDVESGYETTYSPLREATTQKLGISGIQDTRRVVKVSFDVTYATRMPYAKLIGGSGLETTRHITKDLTVYRGVVIG